MDLLSAALIVAALVLVAVFTLAVRAAHRDGFVSARARAVTGIAAELFSARDVGYSEFKKAVPDADAALYADVRALHRSGQLTPTAVQSVL